MNDLGKKTELIAGLKNEAVESGASFVLAFDSPKRPMPLTAPVVVFHWCCPVKPKAKYYAGQVNGKRMTLFLAKAEFLLRIYFPEWMGAAKRLVLLDRLMNVCQNQSTVETYGFGLLSFGEKAQSLLQEISGTCVWPVWQEAE